MKLENILDLIHYHVVRNIWLQRFTVFTRILLAVGFIPPGLMKVFGHPFAAGIPTSEPIGYYFDALSRSGIYYNFIGWGQVMAAVLLLFPRTATLGALFYFPIILNICILTHALQFTGTWIITSFMLLANTYLLCWDYDKFKALIPRRIADKNGIARRTYIIEPLIYGALGALSFAFFAALRVANLQEYGLAGAIFMFVTGALLGLFCVWHRRNLRFLN